MISASRNFAGQSGEQCRAKRPLAQSEWTA